MKKNVGWIIIVVVLSLLLVSSLVFNTIGTFNTRVEEVREATPTAPAIVDYPTETPYPTVTPDPCSQASLPEEVARIHSLTREFEDTAQVLTTTLFRDTSVPLIQELQRIRRVAEDQTVPSCLKDLKAYQIMHMNARIDVFGTALSFLNTYGPNGDQNALNQLLDPLYVKAELAARQYETEYARVLGLPTPQPLVVVTTTSTPKP
jgi:hypothetical protein